LIETVAITGSTNADLLEDWRREPVSDGFWLVARRQSAGRGRLGRAGAMARAISWDRPRSIFAG
jgi:BirA family biotin operon repressor/biotin-[acetyl-CoA-carboxylase] ligase